MGGGGAGIGGRKGDEDVGGADAGDAAVATEAERDAARQALELMSDERSIGGDDDDDGAAIGFGKRRGGVGWILGNFFPHRNTGDAEIWTRAIVALHKHADG